MFISLLQLYVAPMHSHVTNVFLFNVYVTVCVYKYPNVIRIYSSGVLVKITFELEYILMKLIPLGWQHLKVLCCT